MWIVDSSVWIDYFNGRINPQTETLDRALGTHALGVGDLILCEVLQGFQDQREFEAARAAFKRLTIFAMGGERLAIQSAENFRALRRRGITVRKTIDCLIATFVIDQGFALLHNDRDFDAFETYLGLNVVHAGRDEG
jgi:predicted nucleic acid-binding protein